MSKFVSLASEFRLRALLCSSVTVLLAACGGGADTDMNAAATPPAPTAAFTLGDAAPAAADAPGSNPGTAAANFDFVGYAADPRSPNAGDAPNGAAQAAGEIAPADDPAAAAAENGPRLLATMVAGAAIPLTTYNYYVAPTGSDTNPGTKTAPFKTLARAAKATRPSTTVFVAPGTYTGGIRTTINGTASGRIYFVSTTKHGARIVPASYSATKYAWENRGNYTSISGFNVDGGPHQSGTKWLLGIYNGGSYDVISENRVHHIAKTVTCGSGGGSAINTDHYYYGVKSDVIGNIVHDIGPTGCRYIQGIYISTSGSVKNNVVYRVAEAGIHLWHDATNVIITNNTVTTSHTGIIVGAGDFYHTTAPNDYTAVYNNIVIDNVYGISEQGKTGIHNTYRNNLVMRNSGYNFRLLNGLSHYNTVSSDPGFVSYSKTLYTPNFHLTSSSPAIGRGTATYAHPVDFDGRARNAGTGYDIGAFQH